ncbi:MAG: hypothetical protein WC348_04480 [Patescibacteria group bacterium]|jgi:hypothetical protein
MGQDIANIHWQKEVPSKDVLSQFLGNYLNGIGTVEFGQDDFNRECWICTLPGKPTDPWQGISGLPQRPHDMMSDERWFEVYWHDDGIDIITRRQDPITNSIAAGFARACILTWQAKGWEELRESYLALRRR